MDPTTKTAMYVIKRDGRQDRVHLDKITKRIRNLSHQLNPDFVDPIKVTMKVVQGLYPGVTTQELDILAAETAASMTTEHSDYAVLAARLAVSNLHRETKRAFSQVMTDLHGASDMGPRLISSFHHKVIAKHAARLDSAIVHDRDYEYTYFGLRTLERSYLFRIDGKVVERPQHMLMRVAIGIHGSDIDTAIETYNLLSERFYTHASPTMFAAATSRPQLSSCFLLTVREDSTEGIFDTLKQCALISKSAGGIGLNVNDVRAKGTHISGTGGKSSGLVPMLRVYNNVSRFIDQGGKRPGAFAIYVEPWHGDIFEFLDLKKNTGTEDVRARDLFYALWIPDLFMQRVETDGTWSLMCPHKCPGLSDSWGEEFERLYTEYERKGTYIRRVPARQLWAAIIESQVETGVPYMLYKDACNRKSNQNNLGTIRCSNLCTEIVQFSSRDEVAVCNLASISLKKFVVSETDSQTAATTTTTTTIRYDFAKLKEICKTVTRNLNRVIDVNCYPVEEAERSNRRHRPIGIGVQGLADTFILMRYPYDSEQAYLLNQQIFETIYYGALEASCELAAINGTTYESYAGSPVSQGILQYDMWNRKPTDLWDWDTLKARIARHGVYNSLLVAPMPTASTAQILDNSESFEPYTSNIYSRRVLSGEFQILNHHLVEDLTRLGLWNHDMKNQIIANGGSIQAIDTIPANVRNLYRTAWEISSKCTIRMAADRGAFIDQSQSFSLYVAEPTYSKLTSIHFHAWKMGLKTGMYYLRTKPAAKAIQFTVDKTRLSTTDAAAAETEPPKTKSGIDCTMCGS